MQRDNSTFLPCTGLWDGSRIIIKRTQLENVSTLLSTFLHELSHAKSGATDATLNFEIELTNLLGTLGEKMFKNHLQDSIDAKSNNSMINIKEISEQNKLDKELIINLKNKIKKLDDIQVKHDELYNQIEHYKKVVHCKELDIELLKNKKSFLSRLFNK